MSNCFFEEPVSGTANGKDGDYEFEVIEVHNEIKLRVSEPRKVYFVDLAITKKQAERLSEALDRAATYVYDPIEK